MSKKRGNSNKCQLKLKAGNLYKTNKIIYLWDTSPDGTLHQRWDTYHRVPCDEVFMLVQTQTKVTGNGSSLFSLLALYGEQVLWSSFFSMEQLSTIFRRVPTEKKKRKLQ